MSVNSHRYIRVAAIALASFLITQVAMPLVRTTTAQAAFKAVYAENLAGTYEAVGINPSGSRYTGRVQVTVRDGIVYFRWDIAGTTYNGQGTLNGTILTIDWGAQDPVIYKVNPDGSLDGTWDAGKASERLVRIR